MGEPPGTSATPPPLCCEHHGDHQKPENGNNDHPNLTSLKPIGQKPMRLHCAAIFYILFSLVVLAVALAELVLSASNIALIKSYNPEASNYVIGTVILTICAAIAALTVIYSIFSVCKNNCKTSLTVLVILIILAIVQILLVAFAVTFKKEDIGSLEASLTESFLKASKDHDEVNVKLWDSLQSDLKCCGLRGPEDYRNPEAPYLPPQVPFACCLAYKKNETDFYNKWQRDLCIMKKSYYAAGCIKSVADVFKIAMKVTVGVSILLIVLEIIMVGFGFHLSRKYSKNQKHDAVLPSTSPDAQPNQ